MQYTSLDAADFVALSAEQFRKTRSDPVWCSARDNPFLNDPITRSTATAQLMLRFCLRTCGLYLPAVRLDNATERYISRCGVTTLLQICKRIALGSDILQCAGVPAWGLHVLQHKRNECGLLFVPQGRPGQCPRCRCSWFPAVAMDGGLQALVTYVSRQYLTSTVSVTKDAAHARSPAILDYRSSGAWAAKSYEVSGCAAGKKGLTEQSQCVKHESQLYVNCRVASRSSTDTVDLSGAGSTLERQCCCRSVSQSWLAHAEVLYCVVRSCV